MDKAEKADRSLLYYAIYSPDGRVAIIRAEAKSSLIFFDKPSAETFKRCIDGLKGKPDMGAVKSSPWS